MPELDSTGNEDDCASSNSDTTKEAKTDKVHEKGTVQESEAKSMEQADGENYSFESELADLVRCFAIFFISF